MKKCLIVSTVSRQFTLFERGNIETLKELGYEIHCVANYSDETQEIKELGIIKHHIDIQRSPFSLKNIKAYKQLKNIINSEKFELIHCHAPMGGVLARLVARKTRKRNKTKVFYTAHGFHFFRGAPAINWILYYPIEKYLSKYTDCLITINQEDYSIAKNKFKAKRVDLVNGIGVDRNKFSFYMNQQEKEQLRADIGIEKDSFVCICIGELNKNKNQMMAIKAIQNIKNNKIKLLIVGKGDLEKEYEEYIQNNHIAEKVQLLGYRKDINKLLQISDVLLSCSKREGLPVNIIEAMVANIPVITTNCRGSKDLIQNEINGYIIDIDNIEQLIDRIQKIYNKNLKFEQLELDKYDKETIKKKMREIYSSVLQKKVIMLRSTSIMNDSRVIKEAEILCKGEYSVEILGWDRDQFLNNDTQKIEVSKKYININVFRKPAQYAAGMKSIFKLISFEMWLMKNLIKGRKEIDIIHSCDFDTAIPARIVSKIYKKKLVYDIFDYYIDSHYVPNKLKKMVEKAEINIINQADLTIICTEQRKEQIKKANPKKCIVIYNTPKIEVNSLNHKIIKSDNNKLKLVYVGILQENRLLKEIGEEIKENNGIELHIGGFGTFEEYFNELAKKYSNIFYYGKMEYKDVLNLEKDCDILFATYNPMIENHKYSAPNKLYEAMAFGKPIVVCKGTGIDEIVNEKGLGMVVQYNAKDFFHKIDAFDRNKFDKDNVIKLYETNYSYESMEKRLKDSYQEIFLTEGK